LIERDIAQDNLDAAGGFSSSPPGATCPCKKPKRLHVGVFFDGTGNNMRRDDAAMDPPGSKPKERDTIHTNVVRLYKVFPQKGGEALKNKYYLRGVGSIDYGGHAKAAGTEAVVDAGKAVAHSPNSVGLVSGILNAGKKLGGYVVEVGYDFAGKAGGLGGKNRLNMAYTWLKDRCGEVDPQGERTVDVFGFSRGAALARTFVNLVNLGLKKEQPFLRVRFLGIYDTVGSFGKAGDDSDPGQNMSIDKTDADEIAHYTAHHEYRENFPLTLCADANTPYAGCHSDVGGSYPPRPPDNKVDEKDQVDEKERLDEKDRVEGKHRVNHLGFITFWHMYRALARHEKELKTFPLDEVSPLSIDQIETLFERSRSDAAPPSSQMQGEEKAWTTEQWTFWRNYIHQSHMRSKDWWSNWYRYDKITGLISNQIDGTGKRRHFPNPKRLELVGKPPNFDWK